MKMRIRKRAFSAIAAICIACVSGAAGAEEAVDEYPFGLALLPVRGLEAPGPDSGVWMFRLNLLAGCNRTMSGVDIGTVGNWTTEDVGGIALAAGYNVCGWDSAGLQLACVNFTEREHVGVQVGLGNMTWGIGGFQLGVVNATGEGNGLQIGVVNLAESFSGVQLGLLNMNLASELPMMPIVNAWF